MFPCIIITSTDRDIRPEQPGRHAPRADSDATNEAVEAPEAKTRQEIEEDA